MKTINYKGQELKLVEVLVELELDDIIIPAGSKLYYGQNPYNGAEILIDENYNEVADIIIEDDEKAEIIKYL